MTLLARGSGFASRKIARVAGGGTPLPPDLDVKLLGTCSEPLFLQSYSLARARRTTAQAEVQVQSHATS